MTFYEALQGLNLYIGFALLQYEIAMDTIVV